MKVVSFRQATRLLKDGGVGVIPTDTVYGVVAQANNPSAVQKMYVLKKREQKPGTLVASSTQQLIDLGVPKSEIDTVKKWWPNPLSAILTVQGHEYLHQGVGTLAMRVVAHPELNKTLEQTGPLITSSANRPGEPPATTIDEAIAYFGDDVDFYVDGGTITGVRPSTIVRPTDNGLEILRQGSIQL